MHRDNEVVGWRCFWRGFSSKDERWTFLRRAENCMRALTRTMISTFIGLIATSFSSVPTGSLSRPVLLKSAGLSWMCPILFGTYFLPWPCEYLIIRSIQLNKNGNTTAFLSSADGIISWAYGSQCCPSVIWGSRARLFKTKVLLSWC